MDIDNNNTNNNVDEDPIVEEIDVQLIFPRGELYTLDYPIPSVTNKYFQPTNARVRPNHSMLEVVYDTSEWTKSQFFNKEFVSGSGANRYKNRKFLSTKINMRSQYACGQIENGILYLSPISQRLSMRPDFSHIDNENSNDSMSNNNNNSSNTGNNNNNNNNNKNKNNNKNSFNMNNKDGGSSSSSSSNNIHDNNDNGNNNNNNNNNNKTSMVRVQIKKVLNPNSILAREKAYSTLMSNKNAEKWVDLKVVNTGNNKININNDASEEDDDDEHDKQQLHHKLSSFDRNIVNDNSNGNDRDNTATSTTTTTTTTTTTSTNNNVTKLHFDVSPSDYLSAIAPAPKKKMSDAEDMRKVKGYVPPLPSSSSKKVARGGKNELKKKGINSNTRSKMAL